MTTWQLQGAKQRFSEVVRAAEGGEPQFISRHGKPVAVVVDIHDFEEHRQRRRLGLVDHLLSGSESVGLVNDLELPERVVENDREVDLD